MSEKTTKEIVLEGRDEGKIIFLQYDGNDFAIMSAPVAEFINQPADGILYDLNRLEEIALTFIDDPKWVNDFAVALTIRALKEERDALMEWAKLEVSLPVVYDTQEAAEASERAMLALPKKVRNAITAP